MSYSTCPHCGANREGMPEQKPCWRCGRLPISNPSFAPTNSPPPSRPSLGTQTAGYVPRSTAKSYIPLWLKVTGSLGLLLMMALFVGGITLIITAEESTEESDTLSELDNSGRTGANAILTPSSPQLPSVGDDNAPLNIPTNPPQASSIIENNTNTTGSGGNNANAPLDPFAATAEALQQENENDPPQQTDINTPNTENSINSDASDTTNSNNNTENTLAPTGLPTASPLPTNSPAPTLSPTPIICPSGPLARLSVEGEAEVIIGSLRVRDAGNLNANEVLNIVRGDRVTITGAPVCSDGFLWWPIQLQDGSTGWTAEGNATQYFLEPR